MKKLFTVIFVFMLTLSINNAFGQTKENQIRQTTEQGRIELACNSQYALTQLTVWFPKITKDGYEGFSININRNTLIFLKTPGKKAAILLKSHSVIRNGLYTVNHKIAMVKAVYVSDPKTETNTAAKVTIIQKN